MPERIIRPGIRNSDKLEVLVRDGGWMASYFYYGLITTVDDFGRFDARPPILRAEVFPLFLDMVRETDVSRCIAACEKAGLVRLYLSEGKPFLELKNFKQRMRAARSRFPAPRDDVSVHDNVMHAARGSPDIVVQDACEPHDNANGGGGGGGGGGENTLPPAAVGPFSSGFIRFWQAWPHHFRKKGKSKCFKLWKKYDLEYRTDAVIAIVNRFKASADWAEQGGKFIPGPEPWLNDESWEVSANALAPADIAPEENGFQRVSLSDEALDEFCGPLPEGTNAD